MMVSLDLGSRLRCTIDQYYAFYSIERAKKARKMVRWLDGWIGGKGLGVASGSRVPWADLSSLGLSCSLFLNEIGGFKSYKLYESMKLANLGELTNEWNRSAVEL